MTMAEAWASTPAEITDIFTYQAILKGRAKEAGKETNYDEATEIR